MKQYTKSGLCELRSIAGWGMTRDVVLYRNVNGGGPEAFYE